MKEFIDRDTPLALYYQVSKILENQIIDGALKPNDFFGTEQALQESFQVSRATIRKALERLESNGLIYRVTGKGIFVAPAKLKVVLPHLLSFSEEMKKRGMVPGTKLLGVEVTDAPSSVHAALHLGAEKKALIVRRIRLGDGMPIVYSESYVSKNLGLTVEDDYTGSLYSLIQNRSGRPVAEARHSIEGALAVGEIAAFLDVKEGFPALQFRRIGYDPADSPIVYETGVARADKYSYEIHLKRVP